MCSLLTDIYTVQVFIHTHRHLHIDKWFLFTHFFSLLFFSFGYFCVSPSLCVCLSFPLFHPTSLYVSAVSSSCCCKTGKLIFLVWMRWWGGVGGMGSHIEIGNGCRVWPACRHAFRRLTYETPSPTHLFVSELKRREPSVWHDAENLTAGIKVALLLLRLRASVLYSVPDWRHFQWC